VPVGKARESRWNGIANGFIERIVVRSNQLKMAKRNTIHTDKEEESDENKTRNERLGAGRSNRT
jgi:hypothetical protein